ncbi:thioredoxin-like [Bufo gargarizans]|uniref:thioredoxin-like n=1 Tax=Bufo gargarizans TaxID=30331 RepID=UPI001CF40468|nr:thioredoxin-like [Bufo gargarizans]
MVRYVESLEEFKTALKEAGDKLVVVDFTATWCGPCKMIGPFFDTLSTKYADVVFLKVDVDDAADIAAECDIKCMPTFRFYKNEKQVHEFSGANQTTLEQKVVELK